MREFPYGVYHRQSMAVDLWEYLERWCQSTVFQVSVGRNTSVYGPSGLSEWFRALDLARWAHLEDP